MVGLINGGPKSFNGHSGLPPPTPKRLFWSALHSFSRDDLLKLISQDLGQSSGFKEGADKLKLKNLHCLFSLVII